jgi:hypothetical protein
VRRAFVVAAGALVTAIATVFACTFPDPEFAPDTQFTVDGSFVPEAGGSTSSSGSSGSVEDAPFEFDSGNKDGNPCLGDPQCDCDDDKDLALACDGGDCNDHDPRVRSTLAPDSFSGDPPGPQQGDWNCDNAIQFEHDAAVRCSRVLLGGADASFYERTCDFRGFVPEIAELKCSETATFVNCKWNGDRITAPTCIENNTEQRVVRCR